MPLTFDLSREELYTYQGTNPRPEDFDAYWDTAHAEMSAVDPQIEIVPADFQTPYADCSHLYFSGVGGDRIHAKLLRPKRSDEPHPAVVMFHGYSGNSGDWFDKLGYVSQGYTVAALDCRGQGGRSQDRGGVQGWTLRGHIVRGLGDAAEKMLYRQIFLDAAQLAGIVMAMADVDENRVGATGGSQGGALTLACAALEPRIELAAPVFPFLCDYQRVWEMDLAEHAYGELREWFRRFDPRHQREQEVFMQLGYIDIQHLAPRIDAEVLMAVGLMDQICPPSTQFAAYNKISSEKSLAIYPDYGHEVLPGINDSIYQFMLRL
ncbi:MAG: acetylxylan esterase [Proteobacteria bacterium]|nr:acetylxylan esterase [Pseudomonadota bacterium]